ncbi:MAG: hypothetical protein Q9163_001711 [Psora crenata]
MAAVSPPKPWQRVDGTAMSSSSAPSSMPASNQPTSNTTSSTSTSKQPPLPSIPSSLGTVVNRTASNYSPYGGANGYGRANIGTSPYSSYSNYGTSPYSSYSNYSSPYSRIGTMGGMGSMYGGGYGSMYGGGMGGIYGGSMYGQPGMMGMGNRNDPNSLTNSFSQSTQATFQIIENLVGAFGGVAQMLESTYMATHSSFFAMISVAEQFSNLRTTLGSILGIFTLMRYLRTLIAKITGRPLPADATSLTPAAFASFQGLPPYAQTLLPNGQPVPSKKPFLIFLAAVIGLPYLMSKFIRSLAAQNEQLRNHPTEGQVMLGADGQPLPNQYQGQRQLSVSPKDLEFYHVLYDYPPPNQPPQETTLVLSVKAGDLVAVLSKSDPMGKPSDWWQCRARDHSVGFLPGMYLKPFIKKSVGQIEHGRVNTISSVIGGQRDDQSSRANSLKVDAKEKQEASVYNHRSPGAVAYSGNHELGNRAEYWFAQGQVGLDVKDPVVSNTALLIYLLTHKKRRIRARLEDAYIDMAIFIRNLYGDSSIRQPNSAANFYTGAYTSPTRNSGIQSSSNTFPYPKSPSLTKALVMAEIHYIIVTCSLTRLLLDHDYDTAAITQGLQL